MCDLSTILVECKLQLTNLFYQFFTTEMSEPKRYSSQINESPAAKTLSMKLSNPVRISFLRKSSSEEKLAPLLPEFIRRSSFISEKCQLCEQYHRKSQMGSLSNCQHTFCSICLHKYCTYKIDVMEDVTCPKEGCKALIQPSSKAFQNLQQVTKDKYSRNILWKQTISNPNLKLCPKEACQGIIDKSKHIYECNKCRTKYCKQCELLQHNGPCDENFQNNFRDWKRCPQCKMFIERTEGCDHMTCRCNYQFCYVCLARWSAQHYCGQDPLIPQIEDLSCWKRFLLGFFIIIFYPILLALFLAFWGLAVALGSFAGLLGGPAMFFSRFQCIQNICCCLFCPVYMALGSIIGAGGAFFSGFYFLALGTIMVCQTLKQLWCNCQRPEPDLFGQPNVLLQQIEPI